ncbi:MAG: GNAT family N-acetyltransferase [Methyloceanibacter sp.]|jgi:ribosomal-protein-alanine N-acetyltransferase
MASSLRSAAIATRLAGPGDAKAMASIHVACFARSWDDASISQFLLAPGCLSLLAARAQGGPAEGFLIARKAEDEAEILTLAVHPDSRRLGLAHALVQAAMARLRAAGASRLFLEVDAANAPAHALYLSFCANEVGRRPGYYEHGADAVIFSLALSPLAADDGSGVKRQTSVWDGKDSGTG